MSLFYTNTFESALSGWTTLNGSIALSAANGYSASQSLRATTVNDYAQRPLSGSIASVIAYIDYRAVSAPSSGNMPGLRFLNTNDFGPTKIGWYIRSDMKPALSRHNTELTASATALTVGTFYRIGLAATIHGSTGTASLTVDDVVVASFTGNTQGSGNTTVSHVRVGHHVASGSDTIHDFDRIALGSATTDIDPFVAFDEDETPAPTSTTRASLTSGLIYEMSQEFYDDAGCEIRRVRRSPPITSDQLWQFFSRFQADLEAGTALNSGQGSDPKVMLRWSDDGGKTWSNEYWLTAGTIGQFKARAQRNRLGRSRNRVFEIAMTDPIKWAILEGYIDYGVGTL